MNVQETIRMRSNARKKPIIGDMTIAPAVFNRPLQTIELRPIEPRSAIGCMLVDVKMPGLSGIELQAELNKRSGRPAMFFVTSYKDEQTRNTAINGGAFCVLGTPVDIEKLISCLESALGH